MNVQEFLVHARSTSRDCFSQWSNRQLFNLFFVVFLAAATVFTPALMQTPSAALTAGDAQSTIAQAACYGVYHIVRPGQTIYSIAAVYGTTAYRIAACNRYGYTVYVGQSLLIPTGRSYRG